jgi:hypothetical protein
VVKASPERIKHLEFIQATIARQATHSFAVKGWSLTVSAAIYAYAATHLTLWVAIVALLPPVVFAALDAFYLRQERMFRQLYIDSSRADSDVSVFDMDTRPYANGEAYPSCRYKGRAGVCRSGSWRWLHLMILGVGIVLLAVAIFQFVGVEKIAECISDVL